MSNKSNLFSNPFIYLLPLQIHPSFLTFTNITFPNPSNFKSIFFPNSSIFKNYLKKLTTCVPETSRHAQSNATFPATVKRWSPCLQLIHIASTTQSSWAICKKWKNRSGSHHPKFCQLPQAIPVMDYTLAASWLSFWFH